MRAVLKEFATQLDFALRAGPKKILLHGHCHQKSMGLLPATISTSFRASWPATVVDLDATVAWQARSGYLKHRYEVSEAIANRKLIPAARTMEPGDVLVAPGTSCRHQSGGSLRAASRSIRPFSISAKSHLEIGHALRQRLFQYNWITRSDGSRFDHTGIESAHSPARRLRIACLHAFIVHFLLDRRPIDIEL